jgi:hypothetical protein
MNSTEVSSLAAHNTTSSTAPLQPLWPRTILVTKLHSQIVVVDSGATRHMFCDLSDFHKLESIAPTIIKLGDDSTINCAQIGEVVLHLSDGRRLRLNQILYVPRLAINLLSVSQLAKKGIMTSFTKTGCALIDSVIETDFWQRQVSRPEASKLSLRLFVVGVSLLMLSLLLRHHRL